MQFQSGRQSTNIDDRRRSGVPGGAKGLGLAGLVMALVIAWMTGDPRALIGAITSGAGSVQSDTSAPSAQEEQLKGYIASVLGSTEDVWRAQLPRVGTSYREPMLVLFRGAVDSACGQASSAVGPFYCPGDEQVYLDLGFFQELARLGAPGDFAQAYVVAHEVGHHVQKILGTADKVHAARERASEVDANELSVRMELQADFYAGVWAHYASSAGGTFDPGDVEEALNAAAQIGDDNLQRKSQGRVVPESFTHGTSQQRMRWFKKGLETGDLAQGDTFGARNL